MTNIITLEGTDGQPVIIDRSIWKCTGVNDSIGGCMVKLEDENGKFWGPEVKGFVSDIAKKLMF